MFKTFKFFLLSLAILSLAACNDDDTVSTDLEGTWKAQSLTFNIASNADDGFGNTSETLTTGEGQNLDYTLVFGESTYTTSGSYDIEVVSTADGNVILEDTQSVTGVSGSGNYTINGDMISVDGSFFQFTSNGVDLSAFEDEQFSNFSIDGDVLTLTQDVVTTIDAGSGSLETTMTSTSVWERE